MAATTDSTGLVAPVVASALQVTGKESGKQQESVPVIDPNATGYNR